MFTIASCSRTRTLLFGLPFLALTFIGLPAQAQDDQSPSVADAARAARASHGQQSGATAVAPHAPLSQVQLIAWQIAGVSAEDLLAQVKASGIAFSADDQHISPLQDAQLSVELLAALPAAQSHPDASTDGVPQSLVAASQSYNAKDYAGAGHALELLAQQTKSADLYAALGNVAFLSHDLPAAKTAFETATQLNPSFVYAHVRLAGVYYSLQSADQTSLEAKKILKLQPDNAEARRYLSLSLSLRLQGAGGGGASDAGGVEDMSDLANVGDIPQEAKDLNNEAIQKSDEGDYKGAEEAWNKAIKISPNTALFYYSLGNLYDKWGAHDVLAVSNFQKAKSLAPRNLAIRQNLGHHYCTYHAYNDAVREFQEILKMDPDWNIARPCLYISLYNSGRKNEAAQVLVEYRHWNQTHDVPDDSAEIEVKQPNIMSGRPNL